MTSEVPILYPYHPNSPSWVFYLEFGLPFQGPCNHSFCRWAPFPQSLPWCGSRNLHLHQDEWDFRILTKKRRTSIRVTKPKVTAGWKEEKRLTLDAGVCRIHRAAMPCQALNFLPGERKQFPLDSATTERKLTVLLSVGLVCMNLNKVWVWFTGWIAYYWFSDLSASRPGPYH